MYANVNIIMHSHERNNKKINIFKIYLKNKCFQDKPPKPENVEIFEKSWKKSTNWGIWKKKKMTL